MSAIIATNSHFDADHLANRSARSMRDAIGRAGIVQLLQRTAQSLAWILATVVFVVSGCDRSNSGTDKTAVLRVLGEDSSNIQAMESLQTKSPFDGATIDFRKHSFEDALQKANIDFSQGTTQYDVVLQYNFALASFVQNKYVFTLNELKKQFPSPDNAELEKDLFPNVWREIGWYYSDHRHPERGSSAVAYPFAANSMLLVTNRALFSDPKNQAAFAEKYKRPLAAPKTWEEFKDVAEFFTNRDQGTYGVCLQGAAGSWLYYEWCNFLYGMGGSVMDKSQGWEGNAETVVTIDSPAGVRATELYVSLKGSNSGDFFSVDAAEQRREMLKGKTAMAIMWSDYLHDMITPTSSTRSSSSASFDFHTIPGKRSMIAGGSFFVNKKTRNARPAADYVTHVLRKDNQVKLMLLGLCSPRRSTYSDSKVIAEIPYAGALKDSLERGVYMAEAGPDADSVQTVLTEQLQKTWRGQQSPEEAMHEARRQIVERRKAIFSAVEARQ